MASAPAAKASPISVSTSQGWDSDGAGSWSTFAVQVGTPAQTARVLFSSNGYETWVVDPQGCPPEYLSNCGFNRGNLVTTSNSTSWAHIDITELSLETNLGYVGNGHYGYDTVELGYPKSGGVRLEKQVVATIASPDFWLGQIGMDPAPSNFTTLNNPQPSLMWNLVNQSIIPSTTWGYTAGAPYRFNKVQGSLTLGGYDSSRFGTQNVTFTFNNDVARRLVVDLRTISYVSTGLSTVTTSTTLMSGAISIYIDSTIPYIYLPTTVCDRFATGFGLRWDDSNEIYTINDTMHTKLQASSPRFTFTIANTSGRTLDVVLPYAAFDLTASFPVLPIGSNSTHFFPLRRAANDTQYTLGRSFLQEAYLIADYDRKEFTVSPCIWPATFAQNLIAINPPSTSVTGLKNGTDITKPSPETGSKKPIGALIGGIIGGIVVIAIITFLGYYFLIWKPKHKKSDGTPEISERGESTVLAPGRNVMDKVELDANKDEPEGSRHDEAERLLELERKRLTAELGGEAVPVVHYEMENHVPIRNELAGQQVRVGGELGGEQIYEKGT